MVAFDESRSERDRTFANRPYDAFQGRKVNQMEQEKVEEEVKKMVAALDKEARLEAIVEGEDEFRVTLSKGNHSDGVTLSKELLEDFLLRGKRGHELKRALGKAVSKLTLMGQRRR